MNQVGYSGLSHGRVAVELAINIIAKAVPLSL